ncbi:hypothetical protein CA983_34625 [Streptomyces swartbergensis]|uniref:Uncharacterized protein n=2 Tax=Streptomyces TaxID=1883 RepID=A0A5J6I637_STRC4|nr:hypothetical protein CA983_34625 [Streptomyces swartbergensis]QEV24477.1 hypothetical protein CP976_10155 [Streptomyces coeruleorubidus]
MFFQRNLAPADAGDGVSTYLALTFGTLLSSQGTVASFVLTLSGFPPGASLRSCVSDSIRSFSRSDSLSAGFAGRPWLSLVGLSTFTTLTDSPSNS